MSRAALLKRKPRRVEINGESVFVRSLTLREAMEFDKRTKDDEGGGLRYLVSTCVVDEAGASIFASDDPTIEDIGVDVIRELAEAVVKVSAAGSVEKAAKN